MNRVATSLRTFALVCFLSAFAHTPAKAQDSPDKDIFNEPGLTTTGTTRVTAVDVAWNDEGMAVAAFVEERSPRSADRVVLRKRARNDAQWTTILRQDLPEFLAIRDLALAIPRTMMGNSSFDRAYLLVITEARTSCGGPLSQCVSDNFYFTHAALAPGATLAAPFKLHTAPARYPDEPLAAHPAIAVVPDASTLGGYFIAAAYQSQQNPFGNLGPNGLPRGNVYLSVFNNSGSTPITISNLIAGTISNISSMQSAIRPSLTSDDLNGKWLLSLEDLWGGTTKVFSALARDASGNYEAHPSTVRNVWNSSATCTSASISMTDTQFDLACFGGETGVQGGKNLQWVGVSLSPPIESRITVGTDCKGDPDLATRSNRAYSVASCFDATANAFTVRAFENTRAGGSLATARINDKLSTTTRPRAAAFRGDGSLQPSWANGRSLYGYATERLFPASGLPIEAAYIDP
ncbi:MAG: hypothetical protein U0V87_09885 [Acidobacteriota bacterium]